MIDFHCHLDLYPQPQQVTDECVRRNLTVLSVTTTPSAWSGTYALAAGRKSIFTALGLHPQLAAERKTELDLFDELLERTKFVGEIGLDGAPEWRSTWTDQVAVFRHILDRCRRAGGRVLSIHSRRAASVVLDELEARAEVGVPILHWFSGTPAELDRAIALGCWFSVGPAMLLSAKGRQLASKVPRERLLTESDGPFVQSAGRSVDPWVVSDVIESLGVLWRVSTSELENTVESNVIRLLRPASYS